MRNYKKIAILCFVILAISSLIFGLSIGPGNDSAATRSSMPTPTPVAQSQLFFSPATTAFSPSNQTTLDVILDTGGNSVTGIQLEIRYDPEVIRDLSISSGPFLTNGTNKPENLINKIDTKNGRATYALVLPLSQRAVKGKGVVATLTATQQVPLKEGADTSTSIQLLRSSLVTAEGIRKSVLKSVSNSTVTLYK